MTVQTSMKMDLPTFVKTYISHPRITSVNNKSPTSPQRSHYSLFQLESIGNDATFQIKHLLQTLTKSEESLLTHLRQLEDTINESISHLGQSRDSDQHGAVANVVQTIVERIIDQTSELQRSDPDILYTVNVMTRI